MIKDLTSFISGVCFIILSFILFYEANQLSPFASVFPYAITSVLLLLSVLLIIRSLKIKFVVDKEKVDILIQSFSSFKKTLILLFSRSQVIEIQDTVQLQKC